MASNNNRNSSKPSSGMNKNTLMWLALILLVVGVILALYYIQKKRAEGFENMMASANNNKSKKMSNALINATSIKPSSGECVVALFYADWCGHCKRFKPEFEQAMEKLNGQTNKNGKKLRLVKVDCDANKDLAKEYGISGYPTVKILQDDGTITEYGGERSYEGLRKYLVSDN